jgi:type IV pilus assembly protein PilO
MAIQLSKEQQQYVGAGAIAFALVGFVYIKFFWLPISQKKADLADQIEQIDRKISKAQAQASRLHRLQDELSTLNRQAGEAEKRLPKEKSVPDILVSMAGLAQRYHVSIMSFSPGPQKAQTYFIELSYPMTITGTYNDVGRFLAAVALEERIYNVRGISFPRPAANGQMTVNFTLLTYQYKG